MDKKQKFVDKLKGAPVKQAQTIDDYASRVNNHPDIEKQYDPDYGWHNYFAMFLLPITIPDNWLTRAQLDELLSAVNNVANHHVEDDEQNNVIAWIAPTADLKAFDTVGDYVATLEGLLDFVDNKDKHIAKIMNDAKVKELIEKYNLHKS